METEEIKIPAVTTGISLSMNTIQLLAYCISNCPLTEKQRMDLNQEFSSAVKSAIGAMAPGPHIITDRSDGLHKADG
jgi:hypothetical protein